MKQREFSQATETGVGVRIWLGTLPECYLFAPEEWLSDALYRPQSQTPDEIRCAGLRLRIEGLNHSSGILGARFTPEKTERLVVKVPVTLTTTEQANGFHTSRITTPVRPRSISEGRQGFRASGLLRSGHA